MGAQVFLVTGVLLGPAPAVVAEVVLVLGPRLEALVGPARSALPTTRTVWVKALLAADLNRLKKAHRPPLAITRFFAGDLEPGTSER